MTAPLPPISPRARAAAMVAILVVGFFVFRNVFDAGVAAVEAIDPAAPQPAQTRMAERPETRGDTTMYLQVGAFSQRDNANRLRSRLQTANVGAIQVVEASNHNGPLYRVRVGPLASVDEADRVAIADDALDQGRIAQQRQRGVAFGLAHLGVGNLAGRRGLAVQRGRAVKPDLECGICGEHGGDPESVHLCNELGLDYVSCSPFRVPVARLAAAQATIARRTTAPTD